METLSIKLISSDAKSLKRSQILKANEEYSKDLVFTTSYL